MTARHIPSDLRGLTFEAEATFSTDPAGTKAAIRAVDINFQPSLNVIDPGYMKSESIPRGPDTMTIGGKGGKLAFKIPFRGGEGAESVSTTLAKACGFAVSSVAAGADKVTGGAAGNITVLDGDTALLGVGSAIILNHDATGIAEMRFITGKDAALGTTTATVNANWASVPVALDSLLACDTWKPQHGLAADFSGTTLTFYGYEGGGATSRYRWAFTGCAGTLKIPVVKAGDIPYIEFDFQVDSWSGSEANINLAADTLSAAHPVLADPLYFGGSRVATESFGFDPGAKMNAWESTYGTNGREGWNYNGWTPKPEIMPLFDSAHVTAWAAPTTYDVMFASVKDSNQCWAVWCNKCQIKSFEPAAGSFGHRVGKMDLTVLDPGYNGDDTPVILPQFAIAVAK
jgi:hypothetical protein